MSACVVASCAPQAPPLKYDHPFPGRLEVRRLPAAEANAACQSHFISRTGAVAGCSYLQGNRCLVIINQDSLYDKEAVLRHEIAHCNGWPATHP